MKLDYLIRRLSNRYISLLYLEVVMVFVHLYIIPIHPLIFFVWPFSLWLITEIWTRFRENSSKIFLFSSTFFIYILVTQLLVVERQEGIFFNLEPVYNMPLLSFVVLTEMVLLFLYDASITRSVTFRDITAYVGFASTIPWLSPAIVETFIIVRWFLEGRLQEMTTGKGVGGAGLNDILFYYGGRNLVISSIIFTAGMLVLNGVHRIKPTIEKRRLKRRLQEEDRIWLTKAWENPLVLLSTEDQEKFLEDHHHLKKDEQNEVLRNKILPAKGIVLIKPGDMK